MHVVIVVTNLPFDRDRRVQREAVSLVEAGYDVTVISPRGRERVEFQMPAGITLRAFAAGVEGRGMATWLVEYLWCFCWVTALLVRVARRRRIDVVQVCNPPDLFWPIAPIARALGCAWVFDHHDLWPEMYDAQGGRSRLVRLALRAAERLSVQTASAIVATNASFRDLEVARDHAAPERIVVVRNGPTFDEVPSPPIDVPTAPPYDVVYLGVMGQQDGVDVVVSAAAYLVHQLGRRDVRFVVMGDGVMLPCLRRMVRDLGVESHVELPGWVTPEEAAARLRCAAVALQPDQPSRLNDLSTMAKTIEYMAHGVPVVAADLLETRRSAGDAAVYVSPATAAAYADAINRLIDDPSSRRHMSLEGRRAVAQRLAWEHQAVGYAALYERLTRRRVGSDDSLAPHPDAVDQMAR